MRSPLRWAGSKRGLLPVIRDHRPAQVGHYIEPFMGSACVFFDTAPATAQLSDFKDELVGFFATLRDDPNGLITAFESFDQTGDQYYDVRDVDPSSLQGTDRAARFLYLNRFAFNGVYRTNRKGKFNVPRGVRTGALPSRDELLAASFQLRDSTVECKDYLNATASASAGDFVYLDPPYRNESRATFGEYGYNSFGSSDDVQALATELIRLDGLGAHVMLSFNDDDELGDAISGWHVTRIARRRSVAGSSSSRTVLQGEILATNYLPAALSA